MHSFYSDYKQTIRHKFVKKIHEQLLKVFHWFMIKWNFYNKKLLLQKHRRWTLRMVITFVISQSKLVIDFIKWHSLFYLSVKFDQIHITEFLSELYMKNTGVWIFIFPPV